MRRGAQERQTGRLTWAAGIANVKPQSLYRGDLPPIAATLNKSLKSMLARGQPRAFCFCEVTEWICFAWRGCGSIRDSLQTNPQS